MLRAPFKALESRDWRIVFVEALAVQGPQGSGSKWLLVALHACLWNT